MFRRVFKKSQHIVHHLHLSGTVKSGTDADGGNSQSFSDRFAQFRRNTLKHHGKGTCRFKRFGIGKDPFRRFTMTDAILEKTGYDITGQTEEQLREACQRLNVEIDDTMGKGKLIDAIFGQYCEGDLVQPTFVCDYPREMSPL